MILTLTLLAVHLCRGSDIFFFPSYTDMLISSLIFTLLHYELVERLLKFAVPDKQVLLYFLRGQCFLQTSAVELTLGSSCFRGPQSLATAGMCER